LRRRPASARSPCCRRPQERGRREEPTGGHGVDGMVAGGDESAGARAYLSGEGAGENGDGRRCWRRRGAGGGTEAGGREGGEAPHRRLDLYSTGLRAGHGAHRASPSPASGMRRRRRADRGGAAELGCGSPEIERTEEGGAVRSEQEPASSRGRHARGPHTDALPPCRGARAAAMAMGKLRPATAWIDTGAREGPPDPLPPRGASSSSRQRQRPAGVPRYSAVYVAPRVEEEEAGVEPRARPPSLDPWPPSWLPARKGGGQRTARQRW
jgi:hypothetical protein